MKTKQLLIEIPEKDHAIIKHVAQEEGIFMKKLILRAVAYYLKHALRVEEK